MAFLEASHIKGDLTDKRYDAGGIAQYMNTLMASGVLEMGDNLKVYVENGYIYVNYGSAYVGGFLFGLRDNGTGVYRMFEPKETGVYRVVLRKDPLLDTGVAPVIKRGEAGVPPRLERTDDVYEISLAQLIVTDSGVSVWDERLDGTVCGRAYLLGQAAMDTQTIITENLTVTDSTQINGLNSTAPLYVNGKEVYHGGNFAVERGTWTPVFHTLAGATPFSYTKAEGEYYRIDKLVRISCIIIINQVLNGGNLYMTGIPYAPSGSYSVLPWMVNATDNVHGAQRFVGQASLSLNASSVTFSRGENGFLNATSISAGNAIYLAGTYIIK